VSAAWKCTPTELRRRCAFGGAVRTYRTGLSLSQEALGELAGGDRQWVNRVENGAYSPSLDRLWPLAEALRVPLSQLVGEAEAFMADQDAAAAGGRR
jgi:transcriptional regulator with XRE-family HTH domain